MSRSIKFSIIIPTFNRENFILQTLESVFSQTYTDFEVIVVDNASTDSTVAILQPLEDSGKILLVRQDRNYERSRSRNTGMDHAKGDYLTFLDSDDFMNPNCLSDAAIFAKSRPELKCFHNLYELVDSNGKLLHRYKAPSLRNRLKAITQGNFMSCIGNFLHRDVYPKYRFDEMRDLTGGEDWEFWMRIIADHEIGRIEKYNSRIQHHPGRTINSEHIETLERGLGYMVRKFQQDKHLSSVYRSYLARIEANCLLYLNVLANDGRMHGLAYSYLHRAIRADRNVVFTVRFARNLRRTILTHLF